MLAPPLEPRRLDVRLCQFPPCAYLRAVAQLGLQQFLVEWIDESVVLEQERCRKIVTVDQLHLPAHRLVELPVGVFHAIVCLSYEVHYVYYARLVVGPSHAYGPRACRRGGCREGQDEEQCFGFCHVLKVIIHYYIVYYSQQCGSEEGFPFRDRSRVCPRLLIYGIASRAGRRSGTPCA